MIPFRSFSSRIRSSRRSNEGGLTKCVIYCYAIGKSSLFMAHTARFFMTAEDEEAFLRFVERFRLEVYPVRVPPDWAPFHAGPAVHNQLPEEAFYLAASELGPVQVDRVKRGPDKGAWRVDEVRSPVLYFERSRPNEDGELLSGKLWAEYEVTQQTGRRDPGPDRFRVLVLEIDQWLKKGFR